MIIQTVGFEGNSMNDLTNKINTWLKENLKAYEVDYLDTKFSCAGSSSDLGGMFKSNEYKYSALVLIKIY